MKIFVSKGIGNGPTELSAFDQALVKAGVANFNLIYLSSVLPPNSEIVEAPDDYKAAGEWGDKLYIVIAESRTSVVNQEVWSGIGWIQDQATKQGLLVEHHGNSENEVRDDITQSLHGLAENRGIDYGDIAMKVVGAKCEGSPVCALAVAVFESEGWKSNQI